MSAGRPASLDGSLLARKGDAMPAIPPNSPLTEELGEPRPEPVALSLGGAGATAAPPGWTAGWGDGAESRQKIVWALFLVVVVAGMLFAASRLLPTAATVVNASSAETETVVGARETNVVKPINSPAKTSGEIPVKITGAVATEASESTGLPVPSLGEPVNPTPSAGDISAAKTAPVVAVVRSAVKPKPPKPPKPPVSVRSGRYLLQLASLPTARGAKREISRLENRLRRVLGKRTIAVVRAVPKGKSPVYRLRASAYRTRNSARAACDRIKKLKVGCLVVRR